MTHTHTLLLSALLTLAACNSDPPQAPTAPPVKKADAVKPDPADGHGLHVFDKPTKDGIIYRNAQGWELSVNACMRADALNEAHPAETTSSAEAHKLYQEAGQLGGDSKFKEVLDKYAESAKTDPQWVAPVYGAAWALVLMGQIEDALVAYKRVDQMLPMGFKSTKIAIHALQRELDGKLPSGTYARFELKMANGSEVPAILRKELEMLAKEAPEFPAIWKELSTLSKDPDQQLAQIEKGLSYDPDIETEGFLKVNKAILLDRRGEREEAVKLLGDIALAPNTPRVPEYMAKITLLRMYGYVRTDDPTQSPPDDDSDD